MVKSDSDDFADAPAGVVHEAKYYSVAQSEVGGGVNLTKEQVELFWFEIAYRRGGVSLSRKM